MRPPSRPPRAPRPPFPPFPAGFWEATGWTRRIEAAAKIVGNMLRIAGSRLTVDETVLGIIYACYTTHILISWILVLISRINIQYTSWAEKHGFCVKYGFEGLDVVVSTLQSVDLGPLLVGGHGAAPCFDPSIVIVDEASQAIEPLLLMVMGFHPRARLALVGDVKQLPPWVRTLLDLEVVPVGDEEDEGADATSSQAPKGKVRNELAKQLELPTLPRLTQWCSFPMVFIDEQHRATPTIFVLEKTLYQAAGWTKY
jgi:hypothetical protein